MFSQPIITEVSISFIINDVLDTPVHDRIPYMIDARTSDIKRVVTKNNKKIPEWMFNTKQKTLKFIYNFGIQYVECVFNSTKRTITLYKIKYKNFDTLKTHYFEKFFNAIKATPDYSTATVNYKATSEIQITKLWDKNVLADIIMTNPKFFDNMALREKVSTINAGRLFSIAIESPSSLVTIFGKNSIILTMSKLTNEQMAIQVMSKMVNLFQTYEIHYDAICLYYDYLTNGLDLSPSNPPKEDNAIKRLRASLPELFINNYTRECPVLPIMISDDVAEILQYNQRVIKYPTTGPYSRYYTAPAGYFIGLKHNRLSNNKLFPHLVACYMSDHMERTSSVTYKYYVSNDAQHRQRSSRQIPRSILNKNSSYTRKKIPNNTFISALELALNQTINTDNFPNFPYIVKQELWDMSDTLIMKIIKDKNVPGFGSCIFRYFEELYKISIHIVPIDNGRINTFLPRHKDVYIWEAPYPQHVVLFENYKSTYGKIICVYDILIKNNKTMVFESNDIVVSSIISQKQSQSIRPQQITEAEKQLLDDRGKCRQILTADGIREVYTRPLPIPLLEVQQCFIADHMYKLNNAKTEMGIQTIDYTKQSTYRVNYLPNQQTFEYVYRKEGTSC